MSRTPMLSAVLIALSCTLTAQDTLKVETWHADFDLAVAAAKAAKKDLLVDFTGSDWCGWCIKLHEEVFQHASFLDAAQKQYVLVALDFPNDEAIKAKVPNPERNEELKQKYAIAGFPSILLMSADGEVYAKTGYQPDGPEKYLVHLAEIAKAGKESIAAATALATEFAGAKDDAEKKAVIEKAILALGKAGSDSVAGPGIAKVVREALTLDPENKQGLKAAAVSALLDAGQGNDDIIAIAKELDPKNEKGLYEKYVESVFGRVNDEETCREAIKILEGLEALGGIKNKELASRLYANAAMWCKGPLSDGEKAKKWAQKAIDLKPDNPRLVKMLEEILAG